MTVSAAACRDLAAYLSGGEAQVLADRLEGGQPVSMVLQHLAPARKAAARTLLDRAGLTGDRTALTMVLRTIEGALGHASSVAPVWTAPENLAQHGQLTASIHHYVSRARESVVCSTFNFQRSSALWTALRDVAARTEVSVRVYIDTAAADHDPAPWKPTTADMARELPGAVIFRTKRYAGKLVRNHAKFVAVDHQFLLVTSANFSKSAERHNVELGLIVSDRALVEGIERHLAGFEDVLYDRVAPRPSDGSSRTQIEARLPTSRGGA